MRRLLLLTTLLSSPALADDDEFMLGDSDAAPEETRHQWTWPARAHFDPRDVSVTLSWPRGTGAPEARPATRCAA